MSYEAKAGFTCSHELTADLQITVDGELTGFYSLGEDYCWVPTELKKAYELGKKHAIREINDQRTGGRS